MSPKKPKKRADSPPEGEVETVREPMTVNIEPSTTLEYDPSAVSPAVGQDYAADGTPIGGPRLVDLNHGGVRIICPTCGTAKTSNRCDVCGQQEHDT